MWKCPVCGEEMEDQFEGSCWRCASECVDTTPDNGNETASQDYASASQDTAVARLDEALDRLERLLEMGPSEGLSIQGWQALVDRASEETVKAARKAAEAGRESEARDLLLQAMNSGPELPDESTWRHVLNQALGQEGMLGPDGLQEDASIFGPINPAMVCPHCQSKGTVHAKQVKLKQGISGAKATGAILTCVLSVVATGLSKKGWATEAHCVNCGSTWHFS